MKRRSALLGMAGTAIIGGARAQPIGSGPSVIEVAEPAGAVPAPMRVHLHRPAAWTAQDRILVVMHGRGRDADRYRDQWISHADAANLLLVAPEFDAAKFPGRAFYNFGNVVDDQGRPRPSAEWSFGVIDRVVEAVRARSGAVRPRYALFGHSAGAKFVHRYLLMAQATNADSIITANAGSYTMPVRDAAFPWGLGGTAVGDAELARALARPVVVLLGEQDTDPNHPSLPRDPEAQAQGPHRFARGQAFFAAAQAASARLGVPLAWRLRTVPSVGHSNGGMAAHAVRLIASA
jgi:poly(3-hydroxybutyrate) depolymerase